MGIRKKMLDTLERQINMLPKKDRPMFIKAKRFLLDRYEDTILPILLGLTFFYITRKIYNATGYDNTVIFLGVIVVLQLRALNRKIHKLIS